MSIDIEELRKLAQAALWTGRWYDGGCETLMGTYGDDSENAEGHGEVVHPVPLGIVPFLAAVQPATVLGLITEIERLRDDVNGLTGTADALERQLSESRNNDITAMGYLADCRIASGDNGKRMLPDFVEYLRETKQQRDELLSSLRDVVGWVPSREKWHSDEPIKAVSRARAAITNAEKTK